MKLIPHVFKVHAMRTMQTIECDECGCCVERKTECPVCCAPLPKAVKNPEGKDASTARESFRAWVLGGALLLGTGLAIRHHVILMMICVAMLIAGIASFAAPSHHRGASR